MYLKEIKASGFKSFADKTTINLSKGITGIVGPNGSGKSNVVDAIRWVLGEQSVKSLRGDGNMTDVIFQGSKSRNPMNIASVTLILNNEDKYLPLEYDEVAIKRRVYKDGTNEYYLNGEKVRLKDITNLLLDSGIAKESFNIISQGKIEEVISSKPEERRVIFEEASGVLKYKRRKEEAIRKLDKTHDNLNRVGDIIKELEPQITPLKEAKEKAEEYLKAKEELETVEVALITEDITNLNTKYLENKNQINTLEDEILNLESKNTATDTNVVKLKTEITHLENKIKESQKNLLELTTKTEKLNSTKAIIIERKNYEVEDTKLHNKIIDLNEKKNKLTNEIESEETDIININKEIQKEEEKEIKIQTTLKTIKETKSQINQTLSKTIRTKQTLEYKKETLKQNIENGSLLPIGVKSVLNNPKLTGIHNTLGNLIETEEKYATAISTILGYSSNNIIVDNEETAKEAINSIQQVGRATFYPLNIIKPKYIDNNVLEIINHEPYFICVASDLVKTEKIYTNIILNQLGNALVTDDINNAIKLSKKINHRYKIATTNGEIINPGGSLTGGKQNKKGNTIQEKYELENIINQINTLEKTIKEKENQINESDYKEKSEEDKIYLIQKEIMLKKETIKRKQKNITTLKDELEKVNLDLRGTNNLLNGTLSKEEEDIIEKYYESIKQKEAEEKKLDILNNQKEELTENLEEAEMISKKENSQYNTKTKELKELEIITNRLDVKLDNLLNTLSETYSITYEKAKANYKLEIEYNEAKTKVNSLKRKIKDLGIVNLAAKEEYERVSERYNFLLKQTTDLKDAEATLLEIINEMDKIMVKDFKETFQIINSHFEETFKELFKGGKASLKLTEPSNMLETGIEIIASPPGKKLSTISLLSGGEKTLTAISLLFAIIKSRPAPFCVLDEVEAALDEANVDAFGEYVTKLKTLSQFIIITHKKKTMEYADILYGITMQESGVSKLVSVKLEDIEK